MQFLLLIYGGEKAWANFTAEQATAETQAYMKFGKDNAAKILGGNALFPTSTAKTVRLRDGKSMVTDGPFAETKEQLGGYYLVNAADEAEAIALAGKIPGARYGSIEVRAIQVFD